MSPQLFIRLGTLVTAAGLVLQPILAQTKGAAPGAPTAPGSAGPGSTAPPPGMGSIPGTTPRPTPGNVPNTLPPQNQPNMPPQPIFITGRVMLEDGSAPTESVIIERVCNGSPHAEGYTDSKGYFSIRLGEQNNGIIQDASEDNGAFGPRGNPGGPGSFGAPQMGAPMGSTRSLGADTRFFDCEIRARLGGYRSQSVSLVNRRPMDPPDIGVILLHRLAPTEGGTISAVSLAAPKNARKAYDKGMDALKKHKPEDAIKSFQKAVDLYPKYAVAWNELGRWRAANKDDAEARSYFGKAIEADPKFPEPYLDMATIEYKSQNWKQVADLTGKVIQLDSFDYPQAHFLNALSNYYLKNLDQAEKSAREAARLDTRKQFVTSYRLLGVILAQKQDYPGAAEQFKQYLELAPQANDAGIVRNQLAQVEKLLATNKQQ